MHAFEVPPSWEAALSASPFLAADEATGLPRSHVLLIKGQKNSGKSTFARTLANGLSFRYAAEYYRDSPAHQLILDTAGWPSLNVTSANLSLLRAEW